MDLEFNDELTINQQTKSFLLEIAKWSKFLAIMGFIMVGFMIIGGLSFGSIIGLMSDFPDTSASDMGIMPMRFFGVFYIIMALIYLFPILYLFKFANKMQLALKSNDDNDLTEAFSNLKSHYKYIGILTIILLSIYVLIFLFSGLMFAMN